MAASVNSGKAVPSGVSIEGTVRWYRWALDSTKCTCCTNGQHVVARNIEITEYPSIFDGIRVTNVPTFVMDELVRHPEWEGKRVRVTIEVVDD